MERRLQKKDDGTVYLWTETLSRRGDMMEIDADGKPLPVSALMEQKAAPQVIVTPKGETIELPPIDKGTIGADKTVVDSDGDVVGFVSPPKEVAAENKKDIVDSEPPAKKKRGRKKKQSSIPERKNT